MTSRRYCFTSYAENVCPWASGDNGADVASAVRYCIFQREKCPATGSLHWQGYIELRAPVRVPGVQRLIGDSKAHCEVPRGTRVQARDYCRKPESRVADPVEFGEFSGGGQGVRSDINGALDVIRRGGSDVIAKLYDDHGCVMVKYTRGIQAALHHYTGRKVREAPPDVFVHYGDTGSGKTRTVYDSHDLCDLWRAPVATTSTQWFDGYLGQNVALFDDFDGQHPVITIMLQVLDRYPLTVPFKGGHCHWCPDVIYITTNVEFSDWYPTASEIHKRALRRRITKFFHFGVLNEF